jgi:HK97 family phage major capsid protein
MIAGKSTGFAMTTIAQRVATVSQSAEVATRAGEFAQLVRLFALTKGDWGHVAKLSQASARIVAIAQKAAVAAGSTENLSALAQASGIVEGFLESLRSVGAFDRILPDMRRVPLRTRTIAVTLGASGYIVAESAPKPLSSLSLTGDVLAEHVAAAILVTTEELLRGSSPESQAQFRRELSAAIAAVTDQSFISLITTGATNIASAGATVAQIYTAFNSAFAALATDAASKLYILMRSATAKNFTTTPTTAGEPAFPGMSAQGGVLFGAPAIVSDGVPASTVVILDANAIAAAAGDLGLDMSREASLQFESAPDSPVISTTVLQNLWQNDLVAFRAIRSFGAELLRTAGVVTITNI